MIEKIILLPAEQGYTDTTTLAGKLTLIIQKINEIVDHLNETHEKGQFHLSVAPPTNLGWDWEKE